MYSILVRFLHMTLYSCSFYICSTFVRFLHMYSTFVRFLHVYSPHGLIYMKIINLKVRLHFDCLLPSVWQHYIYYTVKGIAPTYFEILLNYYLLRCNFIKVQFYFHTKPHSNVSFVPKPFLPGFFFEG